ncbi:uncharacterized protein [Nicotiana sylvestris]|uniref:uncharacterized protein n=1 Tax=Nicotiana sylvestris TaxID=4096 RepID=UPI00388CE777
MSRICRFPKKWNMNLVAVMPEEIPDLRQWVEGLVSQKSYSEHAWMELSKGQWEARNQGYGNEAPSAEEHALLSSSAPKQGKEKKRKEVPISPSREKKRPARSPHKRKGNVIRASVLHHEAFLQVREERKVEVQGLTKKCDSYKLLSEKLQEDLKEVIQEELELDESQLRTAKENALVQEKKVEKLESHSANLTKELEVARSEAVAANIKAQANATQYKVDVEATLAQAKSMVDHAKWQALKKALEGARDQSFNTSTEIEVARAEETKARRLDFPEEDSEDLSEFDGGEDSEGEDTSTDKDCAA